MFYFADKDTLTVYFADGNMGVWNKDNLLFDKIHQYCIDNKWFEIEVLHNKAKMIMTSDNVKISEQGDLVVDNVVLEHTEEDDLLNMIKLLKDKGVIENDIERIKPFLLNMLQNPYINATHEIYEYCKAMDFEITEDGHFLAYKNVNADYSSKYDKGKTKHAVGQITKVEKFDTNRNQLCSYGLHFCSKSYLSEYRGEVTIIVKVNPKDVCSIPVDYNFTKGRCTQYMMVGVIAEDGTLATTNIKAATGQKVVKTKAMKKTEKQIAKISAPNRIDETASNMKLYKNDIKKVASVMNISSETVKRNMRKFRAKG